MKLNSKATLVEFFGNPENFAKYEKCKSLEERLDLVYQIPMVQLMFKKQNETLKNSVTSLKNDRESKRLRDLGNAAFKQGRDRKALELYSEALAYSDWSSKDQTFGLAAANRSAVLMRFGDRGKKFALVDIDRALKQGHPSPLKLLERKINCLVDLKMVEKVFNQFYA